MNIKYTNRRILNVTLQLKDEKINILAVYAPDLSKPWEKSEAFYEVLQNEIDNIPTNSKYMILGDINARIGNMAIPSVMNSFNEDHMN